MALGARPGNVLWLVLSEGLRPVLFGVAAGCLGAIAVARAMQALLYGLTPLDGVSFANVRGAVDRRIDRRGGGARATSGGRGPTSVVAERLSFTSFKESIFKRVRALEFQVFKGISKFQSLDPPDQGL
jgi:hypothetical protein